MVDRMSAHINASSLLRGLVSCSVVISSPADNLVGRIDTGTGSCYLHSTTSASLVQVVNKQPTRLADSQLSSLFWTENNTVQASSYIKAANTGSIVFEGTLSADDTLSVTKAIFDHDAVVVLLENTSKSQITKEGLLTWLASHLRADDFDIVWSDAVEIAGVDDQGSLMKFDFTGARPGYILPQLWSKFECHYQYDGTSNTLMVTSFPNNDVMVIARER